MSINLSFKQGKQDTFVFFNDKVFTKHKCYFTNMNKDKFVAEFSTTPNPNIHVRKINPDNTLSSVVARKPLEVGLTYIRTSVCYNDISRLVYAYETSDGKVTVEYYHRGTKTNAILKFDNTREPFLFYNRYAPDNSEYKDTILFYLRATDNMLCYRLEKENFNTERLANGFRLSSKHSLTRIGFTTTNRLQLTTNRFVGYLSYGALLDHRKLPLLTNKGKPIWMIIDN